MNNVISLPIFEASKQIWSFINVMAYWFGFFELHYIFSIGLMTIGLLRLKKTSASPPKKHSFSIVVPCHNEEGSVTKTLEAIVEQKYSGDIEIIVVNDRSIDNTLQEIQDFQKNFPRIQVISIPQDSPSVVSPKKRAVEQGYQLASNEILMCLDADCVPPEHWLESMNANFHEGIDIVQGPKEITGPNTSIYNFQKLETFSFILIEASLYSMKYPMLSSAPSLAYKKKLFFESGGYSSLHHLVSGDDDMLVHNMYKYTKGVTYNFDDTAMVRTPGVNSWKGLFSQRARWTSNSTQYKFNLYALSMGLNYIFLWLIGLSPILWVLSLIDLSTLIMLWGTKLLVDLIFITTGCVLFKRLTYLKHFILYQIIQIPLMIAAPIAGNMGWFQWGNSPSPKK